jgi:hypothetical protein
MRKKTARIWSVTNLQQQNVPCDKISTTPWRQRESGRRAPSILTFCTVLRAWTTARCGWFIAGERPLGTYCTGGWLGPRFGLRALQKREICRLCWRSNPDSLVVQSLYLLSYSDSWKTRKKSKKKENTIIRFRTLLKVEKKRSKRSSSRFVWEARGIM